MNRRIETLRRMLRLLLAAVFAAAGALHIMAPAPFLSIMPPWVPAATGVILWTGICELLGAAGLLLPPLRRTAALGLSLYTVAVYPANVQHMLNDIGSGTGLGWGYHAPRLLFQPVIVWWCLFAGGLVSWPFRRQSKTSGPPGQG